MKTLDEVIKALELCQQMTAGDDHCHECPYAKADEYNDLTFDCNDSEVDALHYLKKLQELRSDYEALKTYWTEQQANPPLTWQELKGMEGKPVWIEWTKTEESYWCFVGEWFDDDEMRIYHIGRDYADYIHKTIYTPDIVQAYRKERL